RRRGRARRARRRPLSARAGARGARGPRGEADARQAPLAAGLELDGGDAAVPDGTPDDGLDRLARQVRRPHPHRAARGDERDLLRRRALEQGVQEGRNPLIQLPDALAAGMVIVRAVPRRPYDGAELGRDLGRHATLVHAEVALAEGGTDLDIEAEPGRQRLGGLERPAQVARPDRADRLPGERLGEAPRLLTASRVERRVAPPLDPPVAVPVGLAVADEVEQHARNAIA